MVLRSPSQEPSIWVLRIEIEIGHGTKTKQHWFGFWQDLGELSHTMIP
jgi:hypothetical protein